MAFGQDPPGAVVAAVLDVVAQVAVRRRRPPTQDNAALDGARLRGQAPRRARFDSRRRLGIGPATDDAVLHRPHPVILEGCRRAADIGVGHAVVACVQDIPGLAVAAAVDAVAQAAVRPQRRHPAQVDAAHDVARRRGQAPRRPRFDLRRRVGMDPAAADPVLHRSHPVILAGCRRQVAMGVGQAVVAFDQGLIGLGLARAAVLDAVAQAAVVHRREPAEDDPAHDVARRRGQAGRLARSVRHRASCGQGPRSGDAELVHRPHPVGPVGLVHVLHLQVHEGVHHHDLRLQDLVLLALLEQNAPVALYVVVGHLVPVQPVQRVPRQNGDAPVALHHE